MVSVFDVADILVRHAVRKHGDEIGIIAYYGSYATGTATDRSDLDLMYTPDDIGATMDLYTSFVLDGRPYEFWPISWQRLERMASAGEHWAVSAGLIASGRVLYHRSEEDLDRFEVLGSNVRELQTPERRAEMVGRALTNYSTVLNSLGKLRLEARMGHLPGVRWAGWEVVTSSIECLALVNQTYFSRGWGSNHEEVLRLREKPEGLAELMEAITTSDDIESVLTASEELTHGTRRILLKAQKEVSTGETVGAVFRDYYPGIHEYVDKIVSAAEKGRPMAANYAAAKIQAECSAMLSRALTGVDHGDFNLYSEHHDAYRERGFPDLMGPTAPTGYSELVEGAGRLDARSRSFLREAGLGLNIIEDLDQLKRFLEERSLGADAKGYYAPPSPLDVGREGKALERTLRSRLLHEGRHFSFRTDEVELPSGRRTQRDVVRHPGAVAIVPVLPDGRLILVRQYRYAAGRALLELPAGTLEPGEEPLACARRELREETGYEAAEMRRLLSCFMAPGYSSEVIHLFEARGLRYAGDYLEPDEDIETEILEVDRARELIEENSIEDAKTIIGVLAAFPYVKA